ncbi:hypothetical protein KHO49_13805 [Pseudomonas sp. RC4D1]|uniref:hypothetical protein n=1 Tax=Pseudomonas sp. RC4D1 TaxID=2834407 RepID=UPI001BCC9EE9|nr:hypothetical protein [Pseudomonas sp. RC4D1]MBS7559412.1 hypothetical protein [Pseudomonas sp. RC4D1]
MKTRKKFGGSEVAEIEIFFSTKKGAEFSEIAIDSLGDNIQGYVFSKHHDVMVFLRDLHFC